MKALYKVIFLSLILLATKAYAQSVTLGDFESGVLTAINPGDPDPAKRYLWSQYEGDPTHGPDPGSEAVVSNDAKTGSHSLKITVDSGNAYMHFYPYKQGEGWRNARELIETGTWQFDKFNRLKFWVKVPPGYISRSGGQINTHFGTYVRKSDGAKSSAEDGGGHFYHHLNLPYTGEWHQVIIDWHPNHERGASGGTEHGEQQYVTNEQAYNYFDALTRFYFDGLNSVYSSQVEFYFDGFEFYEDTNPENVSQIYSLNGVYVPSSNEIYVAWQRDKNENDVNHEVRYSFSDIHTSGWDSAIPAPNGTITPPGWQGYNGMVYSTQSIDVSGHTQIYIAIKPQNSNLFRQIVLPLASCNSTPLSTAGLKSNKKFGENSLAKTNISVAMEGTKQKQTLVSGFSCS